MNFNPTTFTPFNIELTGRKFKVSWINMGDYVPYKPFFADAIKTIDKNSPTYITDESPLLNYDKEHIKPTAFIFHVSRCGSTLVSNCLQHLDDTIVISEAQPVSALLVPYAAKFLSITKEAQQNMLRAAVNIYGRNKKHLFIKFSSWNIKMIDTVKALWPQTPILFIYRHPLEVLNSLLLKHPQWIRLCLEPELYRPVLNMTKSTIDKISLCEYFTRMLRDFYSIALENANDIHLLDYNSINIKSIQQFLSYLSIYPNDSELASMTASLHYYSKGNDKQTTFQRTASNSSPEAIYLSKKYLEKYYHQLNTRFAV